jgi:hypothetical protein
MPDVVRPSRQDVKAKLEADIKNVERLVAFWEEGLLFHRSQLELKRQELLKLDGGDACGLQEKKTEEIS